ncbi:hypothetical protein F511_06249 [Dorcoceras hygrometricum]|uniref:Uncharacterized protein n=1 Tax=Dorcoceras hygrometricum TaxID=472368 RepID=A0A2Z7B4V1_9LAMI|nr:hypothetical protein F511_06249 [Dorcoceras hygrometricum]
MQLGTLPLIACAHQQTMLATYHTQSSAHALISSSTQLSSRVHRLAPSSSQELGQLLPDLTNESAHNKSSSNRSQPQTNSHTGQLTQDQQLSLSLFFAIRFRLS